MILFRSYFGLYCLEVDLSYLSDFIESLTFS
jgi:hypothetical protein